MERVHYQGRRTPEGVAELFRVTVWDIVPEVRRENLDAPWFDPFDWGNLSKGTYESARALIEDATKSYQEVERFEDRLAQALVRFPRDGWAVERGHVLAWLYMAEPCDLVEYLTVNMNEEVRR